MQPNSPRPANAMRKFAGPWVIVEVPMDDPDPLYPTRRRFYSETPGLSSTDHIKHAVQFTVEKDATKKANQLMNHSRNTWAEAVPFALAWALNYATGAPWEKTRSTKETPTEVPA